MVSQEQRSCARASSPASYHPNLAGGPGGAGAVCASLTPEVLRKVRQWATFADEDLRLTRLALTLSTGIPYRLIAFHAPQCAEKYLKAYLVGAGIDIGREAAAAAVPGQPRCSRALESDANLGG